MRVGQKILFLIIFPLCGFLVIPGPLVASPRPNVLFILVDDLRPELGCYGADHIKSPNIDRLADSGMLFQRAYCQIAVCNPSRISLLTGTRPWTTGIINNNPKLAETLPELVSLPAHFKKHGYHTLTIGKVYHHPNDDIEAWSEPDWRPFDMGTSTRDYRLNENWSLMRRLWKEKGEQGGRVPPMEFFKGPAYEISNFPEIAYPDGLVAYEAIHALNRLAAQREPFFLAVGFYKPHLPFICPEKYWDMYPPESVVPAQNNTPPEDMPEIAFLDSDELRAYHGMPQVGEDIPDGLAKTLIRGYRACVSFVDAQIGLLLEELDRRGLVHNTVVVLIGDHGWHLGEQGIWGKQTNFENAVRAPLIVRVPGALAKGKTSNALVEFVDIYPTLCELAELPVPQDAEGLSLIPLMDNPYQTWKDAAFSQYPRPNSGLNMGYSMRTDRYRFTLWVESDKPDKVLGIELYDHQKDPRETVNLADRHPVLVEQLMVKLRSHME